MVPTNFKPYIIRNAIEGIVILGLFKSVQLIPISFFMVIFNLKTIISFFIEAFLIRERPRLAYVILSLISFAGLLLMVYPSLKSSESEAGASEISIIGILISFCVAVLVSINDIYTHAKCNYNQHLNWKKTKICFTLESFQE